MTDIGVTSGKMIFLVFASIFIGTSFCTETKEIEVFCPNGWLAQGQVIYGKKNNTVGNNHANESEYSLCLICQITSILQHPYNITEVCVSTSKSLLKYNNSSLQCQTSNCKSLINNTKDHWKLLDQCNTLDYQPICGMKINMTHKTLLAAMENVEFVSCKNFTHHNSFFESKLYFSVDLVCPVGSFVESVKVKEAKFGNNDTSEVFCLICNLGLNSSEATVSLQVV